jgi:acylphosphatase
MNDDIEALKKEIDRLYGYLEECQDAMLEVLSQGKDPEGMADLQRKITNALQSRAFSKVFRPKP